MYSYNSYKYSGGVLDIEVDKDIDAFQVFDDIIKNYGSVYTIDDNVDKQPTKKNTTRYYNMGYTEIGKQLNISRLRVQQIEHKALRKLREAGLGTSTYDLRKKLFDFY